ncbi:MAG: hypothetical protein RRY35_00635 [Clostridiales bacterium]
MLFMTSGGMWIFQRKGRLTAGGCLKMALPEQQAQQPQMKGMSIRERHIQETLREMREGTLDPLWKAVYGDCKARGESDREIAEFLVDCG